MYTLVYHKFVKISTVLHSPLISFRNVWGIETYLSKQTLCAEVVNTKIKGHSTRFRAKQGGRQVKTKNITGEVPYKLCLYFLYGIFGIESCVEHFGSLWITFLLRFYLILGSVVYKA